MASAWDGAAAGLETGFRLAMDVADRKQQTARQSGLDARAEAQQKLQTDRQAQVDARVTDEHEFNRSAALLKAEQEQIAAQGKIYAAYDQPPQVKASYVQRVRALQAAQDAHKRRFGQATFGTAGPPPEDIEAKIKDGTAPPEILVDHLARVADMPIENYLPTPEGGPSVMHRIGQAISSPDPGAKLQAINTMLHASLQKSVGKPGRFPGTTIVGTEVANVVPSPASTPDNEIVIPTLKVWVSGAAGSGDEARTQVEFRKKYPDAPPGATGYYLAPMTEGRSSDPKGDPNVKQIRIADFIARAHQGMQLAELMATPEGQTAYRKRQEAIAAQPGGDDPQQQYLAALGAAGVAPAPKFTTKHVNVPAGGRTIEQTYDSTGRMVNERAIDGPAKQFADTGVDMAEQLMQDYPDRFKTIDDAAKFLQNNGLSRQPSKYSRGGAGLAAGAGGEGGGEGGDGLSAAQKRKLDADRLRAKDLAQGARDDATAAETALRDFNASVGLNGHRSIKDPEVKAEGEELKRKAQKARDRATKLRDELDKLEQSPAAGGGAAAPAAKRFDKTGKPVRPTVLKFDKSGNRVGA